MAGYFHIFGKKRCKFCTKAKKLLESKKLEHVVSYLEKAPGVLKTLQDNNGHKTVPLIFEVVGNVPIFVGGSSELEEYLDEAKEEKGRGEGTDLLQSDTV
jgi:glutaredoxin